MKAFIKYTSSSINNLSSRIENLGLFKSYYYNKNFKEKYTKNEDYNIRDLDLFTQVFNSHVKDKKYNDALSLYYTSYATKHKKPLFNIFKRRKWESDVHLHNSVNENLNIAMQKVKKSVLSNKNTMLLGGLFLKKDRREYVFNQRWNILFFVLVLWLYTNIPSFCFKSASNI